MADWGILGFAQQQSSKEISKTQNIKYSLQDVCAIIEYVLSKEISKSRNLKISKYHITIEDVFLNLTGKEWRDE